MLSLQKANTSLLGCFASSYNLREEAMTSTTLTQAQACLEALERISSVKSAGIAKLAAENASMRLDAQIALPAAQRLVDTLSKQGGEFFLLSVLADIRQKTGVGDKPMLSELADTLAAMIVQQPNECTLSDIETAIKNAQPERIIVRQELRQRTGEPIEVLCEKTEYRVTAAQQAAAVMEMMQAKAPTQQPTAIAEQREGLRELRADIEDLKAPACCPLTPTLIAHNAAIDEVLAFIDRMIGGEWCQS